MNLATKTEKFYCYTRAEAAGEEIERVKDKYEARVRKLMAQRDALQMSEWFTEQYNRLDTQIVDLRIKCDEEVAHLAKIANEWDPDEQDARDLYRMGMGG